MNVAQLIELLVALGNLDKGTVEPMSVKPLIGEKVIVRCRDAGVHFGTLADYAGREVQLNDSRRMYYWKAKSGHTLSGCAVHGITSDSKITASVTSITLLEACEIIPCTEIASNSIGGADEHNA